MVLLKRRLEPSVTRRAGISLRDPLSTTCPMSGSIRPARPTSFTKSIGRGPRGLGSAGQSTA